MSTVSLRDAEADLSELVAEVINGGTVTITKDGKPVAAIVPIEVVDADEIKPSPRPSFLDHLKAFPEPGMVFERNGSTGRDVDL